MEYQGERAGGRGGRGGRGRGGKGEGDREGEEEGVWSVGEGVIFDQVSSECQNMHVSWNGVQPCTVPIAIQLHLSIFSTVVGLLNLPGHSLEYAVSTIPCWIWQLDCKNFPSSM